MPHEKTVNGIFYLKHQGSWFGFSEPANFTHHAEGGCFTSKATGLAIKSTHRQGYSEPQELPTESPSV